MASEHLSSASGLPGSASCSRLILCLSEFFLPPKVTSSEIFPLFTHMPSPLCNSSILPSRNIFGLFLSELTDKREKNLSPSNLEMLPEPSAAACAAPAGSARGCCPPPVSVLQRCTVMLPGLDSASVSG